MRRYYCRFIDFRDGLKKSDSKPAVCCQWQFQQVKDRLLVIRKRRKMDLGLLFHGTSDNHTI